MSSAEARFSNSLRPRKPEGSLGRTAQNGHLDSHTAPELWAILHEWLAFYSVFLNIHSGGFKRWYGWCHMKLLHSRRVLCTSDNHAPCHFMQSHIRMMHACLAVTCQLHFWQNNRDLLRATAVTRGWNSLRCKMGIEGAGYSCCHNYFTMAERTELIIIKSVTDEGGGGGGIYQGSER